MIYFSVTIGSLVQLVVTISSESVWKVLVYLFHQYPQMPLCLYTSHIPVLIFVRVDDHFDSKVVASYVELIVS